jgi:hypothetical protein
MTAEALDRHFCHCHHAGPWKAAIPIKAALEVSPESFFAEVFGKVV